jgi:hypothetical protein
MDRRIDVIDPDLLKKAEAAQTSLAAAEHEAAIARAEYNAAIRRLHLGGASLREIAETLRLSHQRVQQIVNEAGGTWWQRVWRTRNAKRDLSCTFCERTPSELSKLLAGPDLYICDECASSAERALAQSRRTGRFVPAAPRTKVKCSFCRKPRTDERTIATSGAGNICKECVAVCRDILDIRT